MTWFATTSRIFFIALFALAIGAFYGYPLQALILLLAILVGVGLYQMRKVQIWLQDPEQLPPDAYGMWGELLTRIYSHQRKNRDIRRQLQANIEYLQDSFSSMRDGVVMVDEQGGIKWFNFAAEPLLGLQYPNDAGQMLTNLVRDPEFTTYFLDCDYQRPLQYRTDSTREQHLRIEISRFGEGERLLFVRDVSESVRLERMRSDFVANVSHELRTPLTVISGYLNTLLADADNLPAYLEKPFLQMNQQALRMENLLRDLLWLSRIENEEREEKKELVDVAALLQELIDEFTQIYPSQPIVLQLQSSAKIYGDYRELYSALSNLVDNAMKYSPDGEEITVRCYASGGQCCIDVQDRGAGFDPIHIPRLTERFYRVDDSRASTTGGTGLGLAIVKHVMTAHNGDLKIASEPLIGSTFTLIFPEGDSDDT